MDEYIKREQVLKLLESAQAWGWSMNTLYDEMQELPAADVVPVVHGRWTTPRGIIECSKCGFGMFPDGYFFEFGECVHANESQYRPNFCPNCGAKCDLEE